MTFRSKHKSIVTYLASFLLPLTILGLILLSQNIYWKSPTTILASDGFHQYVIFAQNLRNILHGQDSIFYTFTSGLGLNFYALISYYLGSFLSPFTYFFDLASMPDALYLFTLIKVSLMGVSAFVMLRSLYKSLHPSLTLALSTSYGLMSFAMSQLEINMWLDVFAIAPLIILGLHRLLYQQKGFVYYLTLSILFIQNYYFGFMMAIFLVLYTLVQLPSLDSWKIRLYRFIDFIVFSLLAGLTSAVMLLPTYLDLSTHGEKFTELSRTFTENSWFLDLFAKGMVGVYDTTKFGALPTFYIGLLPFFLTILFFTIKEIKWTRRLAFALFIAIFIASFYLQPLDLLWQGMHAPNMFLHRYTWLLSLLIIIMAGESLTYIRRISSVRLILAFIVPCLGFLLTFIFKKHYHFLNNYLFIFTVIFTAVYILLIFSKNMGWIKQTAFVSFILAFTILELTLNTNAQILGIKDEWVFPTREGYERNLTDIDKLVNYANQETQSFFRMERHLPQTGNDSMKFGYNGISQFSSIRNRTSSSVLDRLGYQSTGTNLNLRYQNNTLITDSLFAIRYLLASENMSDKYGYRLEKTQGTTQLYRNSNASQLAILTEKVYKDVNFTINTLDNQTALLNQLTGLNQTYFYRLPAQLISGANQLNATVSTKKSSTSSASVTYSFTTQADSQVYLSMPNISFANSNNRNVTITINNKPVTYTTDDAYSFFDLGKFKGRKTMMATVTFPNNAQVSFQAPHFYGLNLSNYQKAMDKLKYRRVNVTTDHNRVTANYHSLRNASLFFTLPYDKGWTATLDGKKVPIRKAQNGFMAVDVTKGSGTVILTFIPNGFGLGVILSAFGILGACSYLYLKRRMSLNK